MKDTVIRSFILTSLMLIMFAGGALAESHNPGNGSTQPSAKTPATLYFGGDILTMDGDAPGYVEAVVSAEGEIVFVGKRAEARTRFPDAHAHNLQGKFLMPSFRDPHGHFAFAVQMMDQVNVSIPPVGPVRSIADVLEQLEGLQKGAWSGQR